ncbi:odorant receptor 232 [Tribolium castaneum]|uniref:Odorant receptor n=1 Tax=Tribolium castaneum TaxID=7070 RepID=D2A3Z1_TRICA|nr:odorant receptor 232 [Tribolium castaneum]
MLDLNDPFAVLKKFYIDFGYHKIVKSCNTFFITLYSLAYALQIYYLIYHFTPDIIQKYSLALLMSIYLLSTLIFSAVYEKTILQTYDMFIRVAWPHTNVSQKLETIIQKRVTIIKILNNFFVSAICVMCVFNMPLFGDQSDFLLSIQVFGEYFGDWSFIPSFFYYLGFSILGYNAARMLFILLYGVLHLEVQILLINELVSKFSEINTLDDFGNEEYQSCVYTILCDCITHDVVLKKIMSDLSRKVQNGIPIFLIVLLFCLISLFFFTLTYMGTLSFIMQFRMVAFLLTIIVVIFSYSMVGQHLLNQASLLFDELLKCPWYVWSTNNHKIYQIFLLNSIRPIKIIYAGVCLDGGFFLSMTRITFCNAYMLKQLRDS